MNIDEVINSDYAYKKALADGTISNFHGFRFIHTERLALSQGAGGDERQGFPSGESSWGGWFDGGLTLA